MTGPPPGVLGSTTLVSFAKNENPAQCDGRGLANHHSYSSGSLSEATPIRSLAVLVRTEWVPLSVAVVYTDGLLRWGIDQAEVFLFRFSSGELSKCVRRQYRR
jgi:hypothetical protein